MTLPDADVRQAVVSEELLRRRFESGQHSLYVVLADWARRRGRPEEARSMLERGLERGPERIAARVLLGRVETQLGRIADARRHYRKVLEELDPRNLPALRALAAEAIEDGKSERARELLARWRREDAEDPELAELLDELSSGEESAAQQPASAAGDSVPESAPELPSVLDLPLAEVERDFMPAPSLRDRIAWEEAQEPGSADAVGKES